MPHSVRSRFSIFSERLSCDDLTQCLPWKVLEAARPSDMLSGFVTTFDLGIGEHERVDHHLTAAKHTLLAYERELELLLDECRYGLWVFYDFPASEGAFNIQPSLHSAFGFLRVEIIFHLKPT